MTDLDKRLDNIELQLQVIAGSQSPLFGNQIAGRSDEVDLRELFAILWRGKWWIICFTFLLSMVGVGYALSLPNMYKSEGIYAPAQKQGGGGLAAQYGGLAAMAGINLGGGESSDVEQAMALISSWSFIDAVVEKYDLKPLILGVEGWNPETRELKWDLDVYDSDQKKWTRNPPKGKPLEPTSYEAYKVFRKRLSVSKDTKTGLISIGVESYSPELAARFVDLIVKELNDHFQKRDVNEATKNINYLEKKIGETSIAGMQTVFYSMIEAQMKTLMLAEVGDQYTLKTVVNRTVSEERSSPNRFFVLVIFIFSGSFFGGVVYVFYYMAIRGSL